MGPFELLKTIVDVLEDLQIPYLVTGAVASIAYGEPRRSGLYPRDPSLDPRLRPHVHQLQGIPPVNTQ